MKTIDMPIPELTKCPTTGVTENPCSTDDQVIATPEREFSDFALLSPAQKRFHILFYALASFGSILLVQVIWQIAELTSR